MEVLSKKDPLIEKTEPQIVVSSKKPSFRIAYFLKPTFPFSSPSTKTTETLINPPPIISSKPISSILQTLSSKVHFNGWRYPQKKWNSWVEKLTPKFQATWKKASIFEAIMASTLEIPKCKTSIFAFSERWCSETNTFVLPWGEVTLTLEDIMVLGGYSITGDSVLSQITSKKDLEIEESLLKARLEIVKSNCKKASQSKWIEIWMENEREFEHEAFLSLWLSRYVLPADSFATINNLVFQIAIILAKGTKIALAPAILASIYRDLRLLNEKIKSVRSLSDQNDVNVSKLAVWAPLQLLQAWIWERFPILNTKTKSKSKSETKTLCRLERWHKVKVSKIDDIDKAIDSSSSNFVWRPYLTSLNKLPFDYDLETYVRCIRVSQLVGLDCCGQYAPHRVAMQFGLDQDVPMAIPCLSETRENAWKYYNREVGDIELYMPPKSFQPGVTSRYLDWWIKSKLVEEGNCLNSKVPLEMEEKLRIKMENNNAEVPPGFSPSKKRVVLGLDDNYDEHQPCFKRSSKSLGSQILELDGSESNTSPSYSQIEHKKIEKEKDDNDDNDDELTLSQLFKVKGNRSRKFMLNKEESPRSSEGENNQMPIENCIENGHINESNVSSSIKCEVRTTFNGVNEFVGVDSLARRIMKLQKIVDMVKEAKSGRLV